jgi:hypothetical protein
VSFTANQKEKDKHKYKLDNLSEITEELDSVDSRTIKSPVKITRDKSI